MYTQTFTEGEVCMGWKIKVLVQGIGPRYLVRGIDPRYLVLSGFGPRYWS